MSVNHEPLSAYEDEKWKEHEKRISDDRKFVEELVAEGMAGFNAHDFLNQANRQLMERASQRDSPDGERSMRRCVAAFNALYGTDLTETQGWQFMSLLKKARAAQGAYREDDYVDDAAYAALAGESASM